MIVRAATEADVPAIAAILAANGEHVTRPDMPGAPYVEHIVGRPGARIVVGELDGSVAGMAGSIEVGGPRRRFLTDLYVDPARQSRGVGRAVLEAAMDGANERMTFSSRDPRALAAYVRNGMRPWWPMFYVEVPPGRLGDHDPGVDVRPADVAETAGLSLAWTGVDRSVDFAFYARFPESAGFAVVIDGGLAAVGWAGRESEAVGGRWLEHASIAPDADPVRAAFAILRAAAGGERLGAAVPGPHPAVAPLFELGGRFSDVDQFCATDRDLLDPERIIPSPGLL
jgi:GNAT superfamily N-acetyltransferase